MRVPEGEVRTENLFKKKPKTNNDKNKTIAKTFPNLGRNIDI